MQHVLFLFQAVRTTVFIVGRIVSRLSNTSAIVVETLICNVQAFLARQIKKNIFR